MKYINAKTLGCAFVIGTIVAVVSLNRRFGSLSNAVDAVLDDPRVRDAKKTTTDFAKDKISDVEEQLSGATQSVADSVQDTLANARDTAEKTLS